MGHIGLPGFLFLAGTPGLALVLPGAVALVLAAPAPYPGAPLAAVARGANRVVAQDTSE